MAKIGEGDQRWIVQQRDDGANVNSWHWEEKDLSKTTHAAMKELFKGKIIHEGDGMTVKFKEISDIDGDVTIAQRKSKIMCYFELKMTIKWGGSVDDSEDKVDGKMVIHEVDHDCLNEDYDIVVSASETNKACQKVEANIRVNGRQVVRKVIKEYFDKLYAENRVGMNAKTGMPIGQTAKAPSVMSPKTPASPPNTPASGVTDSPKQSAPPKPAGATSFSWSMEWGCPQDDLYGALMREERASVYTRAPAKIDPRPSGVFEFLGGVITGYFVALDVPNKITMQWRLSSWGSGIHSSVVIELRKEESGVTRMEFSQAGIPAGEIERVKQGWQVNFFDPIKMMFGYKLQYL